MGMAEDMEMLQLLQASAGAQSPQQGMMPEQMMQQQQPQAQQIRNPIASGSEAAIAATKRSLEMSDAENNRALGRSIIQMMSNVYKQPSWGTSRAGNIGALGASFGSGLEAYDRERDRIANINHMLQAEQKREEALARREEREMKKMEHDMKMAQQNLAINQGYFGLEKQKREDERQEHKLFSEGSGKIPMPRPGTTGFQYVQQYLDKKAERGEAAAENIHTIDEIAQILQDDPDITKDWSIISLAAQRNDPSIARQKLNSWFIPEERRVRAELLAKGIANLSTGRVKGSASRAMNKMYEKWLKEGTADTNMLAGSMRKVLRHERENNFRIQKDWVDSDTSAREGFFERTKPIELKQLSDKDIDRLFSNKDEEPNENQSSHKSNEAILEEIKQLEEMMKTAPE